MHLLQHACFYCYVGVNIYPLMYPHFSCHVEHPRGTSCGCCCSLPLPPQAREEPARYSTRSVQLQIWERSPVPAIQVIYLNPCMGVLRITYRVDVRFSFFDWMHFWGIRKFGHEGTSRWAILPPSNEIFVKMLLIDFLHQLFIKSKSKKSMSSI